MLALAVVNTVISLVRTDIARIEIARHRNLSASVSR